MTLPCDAIFFDFDGVIVDSAILKLEAFVEIYRPHGEAVTKAVRDYQLAHGGVSRIPKFRYFEEVLLGNPPDEARIAELATRYEEMVVEQVVRTPAIAGAEAFLERFSNELPMFVVSGTPEEELRRIVDRRGLTRHFRAVRGAPKVKEVIVAELLEAHGLTASRCVFVGDATTDFDAAAHHAMPFVGVVAEGVENLFPEGTVLITDLRELERGISEALG
ncbi:HAD family hydrolase [Azospirillum sp. SYSU D00513]|uniref:HAD family hydrolase n=1 Tax=Azospirillum sp. SYSU D00513 TaxID=2812561 RepID=UPI001A96F371|nr:HAD family hydrolase [Azospirillum sp. SYSU D00513]